MSIMIFSPDAVKELSDARHRLKASEAMEEMVDSLTQQKVQHAEELDKIRKEARYFFSAATKVRSTN